MRPVFPCAFPVLRGAGLSVIAAALLSACGGGGDTGSTPGSASAQFVVGGEQAAPVTSSQDSLPPELAGQFAQPLFHLAPVVLDTPDDRDMADAMASASGAPHSQRISGEAAAMGTARLTLQAIQSASRMQIQSAPEGTAGAMATGTTVTTYTPAQIRAAYGLPALPAAGASLTAAQAAQLGAGQTIYIVDAKHNPNVASELAAFNQKFGLPACTSKPIAAGTALPLAAASTTAGCVLSVAYATAAGDLTNTAPAYDSGWATEIALDVQWTHAIAPLARIVLIESPDSMITSLLGGISLANRMGPGLVSMSFGGAEGSWTSSVDSTFSAAGMSYFAATGDSGTAVNWPAVSPRVLAVGGTSLSYSATAGRKEVAWSKAGGGLSAYVGTPTYQASGVPGVGSLARRGVADVAFNADPATGQYVAVIPPGSTTASWLSAGGTSISAPQWAGLMAVANAMRVQAAKTAITAPHQTLYSQLASTSASYASAFADVSSGTNGSCSLCTARAGYDVPTGLGTPNASNLLSTLSGLSVATPPVVSGASLTGTAGTPWSYTVQATAANPLSYTLSGAPSGMAISTTGVLSWASPVAGSYAMTVTVKDTKTQLSAQATVSLSIASPQLPPVIKSATLTGVAGKAFTGGFSVSDPGGYAMTISISGIPAGMLFSLSGQTITARWASPVTGNYKLSVTARNALGLSSQATIPIVISAK